MRGLPVLRAGNLVAFGSDEDLRVHVETYLSKGGLAVQPEIALEPLETLEVRLVAPRLLEPLTLRCEVVGLQSERALLRVLEPSTTALTEQLERALTPPAKGVQEMKGAPHANDAPATNASTAADESASRTARNEAASEGAPPRALPPVLSGDLLRFASEEDFNAAGRELYLLGAVMASCDVAPLPGERRRVRLQVGARLAGTPLTVSLQPGPGGMLVVQLEQKAELGPVLAEVLPPKAPPEVVERVEPASSNANHAGESGDDDSRPTRRPGIALRLEPAGPLVNPTSAEGILKLALPRPLTEEDLVQPSTHLLLRWLLSSKGTVRVTVEMPGAHPFVVLQGREVRAAVDMPTLGRGLVEPEGRYTVVEIQRPPRMTHGGTMLQLLQEVISGLVGKLSDEELERGLAIHGERNPLLNDVGKRLLEGLGFSSTHTRLARKALTGKESVYDVTRHAAGARSAFEVLYTLEVSGGLDWVDAERAAREERQRKERERLDRLVEGAAGLWEKIRDANHFEAMGLHWSTPPRKIEPAYRELARLYGPKGEARAEAPEICELIWQKVERAYAVLSDASKRRAHRKEAYALKWSAQIDVLLDRADIAVYRKDYEEAHDLLMVCQDIHPTPAAAERLLKLEEARIRARTRAGQGNDGERS